MSNPLHLPATPPADDQPTQTQRPWRTTLRTTIAAAWGLVPLWPVIVGELNLDRTIPWVAGSLAVTAALTRIAANPRAEAWLAEWLPWLAADPTAGGKHRKG
ncbi:hypothetical protein [Dietzia sp. 179-F 9C3 NHS]|uniref:hypothetical protein n=1 Tax=Dietzia sp. 179-F 9C3 NHS TaxID=3374295 RepID=UPI00387910FA